MKKFLRDKTYLAMVIFGMISLGFFSFLVCWLARNDPSFKGILIFFSSASLLLESLLLYCLFKKGLSYVAFGKTGVVIKASGKKNTYDYQFFHFVQCGYYMHTVIKVKYLVISPAFISEEYLTRINMVEFENVIIIRATRRNLHTIYPLLPQRLQERMKKVFDSELQDIL